MKEKTKFEITEKCLISCKIANLTKDTRGTVTAHIMWAAYPCVYSGVWRYLQECKDGSPLFIYNSSKKISPIGCLRRTLVKSPYEKSNGNADGCILVQSKRVVPSGIGGVIRHGSVGEKQLLHCKANVQ